MHYVVRTRFEIMRETEANEKSNTNLKKTLDSKN